MEWGSEWSKALCEAVTARYKQDLGAWLGVEVEEGEQDKTRRTREKRERQGNRGKGIELKNTSENSERLWESKMTWAGRLRRLSLWRRQVRPQCQEQVSQR